MKKINGFILILILLVSCLFLSLSIKFVNATAGDLVWNYTTGDPVTSSPAVSDGVVFVGSNDDNVYALNASTGSKIWNYTTGGDVASSPAVSDGVVFVGSTDDNVYALNASTGSKIWNYTTGGDVGQDTYVLPFVSGGVVFIGSYDFNMYALNASTGSKIWNYTTGGFIMSSPAVSDGVVYFGSMDANMYALNASTGSKIWNYTTGEFVVSSPAVSDGVVFVGSTDDNVYALNASTGSKIWNYTTGGDIGCSSAFVSGGVVFIGSYDFNMYALNASTGSKIWNYTTGDAAGCPPYVSDGVIYFGSDDNTFYALNSSNGNFLWNYATSNDIWSRPIILGNIVYFCSKNNNVYALDIDRTSPSYSSLSVSTTVSGVTCLFNASFNDDFALESKGQYIFETNNTGSWVAEAAVNFTGTPQTVSVSKTLNTTSGDVVSYRWNFTDNAGNSNTTGIQSITLTAGSAPTMGGFEAPSTAYGNTYFWVNVTVNDVDGIQQIKNASVELSYGVILGWDNATDVFSEVADPGGFCTLDTVTSITTDLNVTAIEVSWFIQLNTEFQDGSVDVVAANTKAFDTVGLSGSGSSTALFQFNDNIGGGGSGGGGGGGGGDSGSGTVNPISDPPKVITDIAEALNISPLGVYAILGALGLITLGGITATSAKVRKGRKSNPKRQYRG